MNLVFKELVWQPYPTGEVCFTNKPKSTFVAATVKVHTSLPATFPQYSKGNRHRWKGSSVSLPICFLDLLHSTAKQNANYSGDFWSRDSWTDDQVVYLQIGHQLATSFWQLLPWIRFKVVVWKSSLPTFSLLQEDIHFPSLVLIKSQNSEHSWKTLVLFNSSALLLTTDFWSVFRVRASAERQTHTCISSLSLCGCSCLTWGVTIAGWGIPVVWGPGGPGIIWCENLGKENKYRDS